MATTKSMSKPTEKRMETKWDGVLALHEGSIEVAIPAVNVSLDEASIAVVSNDRIRVERTGLAIGRVELEYVDGQGLRQLGALQTRRLDIEAAELVTLRVTGSDSVVQLGSDVRVHARTNVEFAGGSGLPGTVLGVPAWGAGAGGLRDSKDAVRDGRVDVDRLIDSKMRKKDPSRLPIYRGERLTADNIRNFYFLSIEEAIIAFAIVFHPLSVAERQEWGGRLVPADVGYRFDLITSSALTAREPLADLTIEERNRITIHYSSRAVTIVHTHWDTDPNRAQGFGSDDIGIASRIASNRGTSWTEYVIRPDGSIVYKTFNSSGQHGGERVLNKQEHWD